MMLTGYNASTRRENFLGLGPNSGPQSEMASIYCLTHCTVFFVIVLASILKSETDYI